MLNAVRSSNNSRRNRKSHAQHNANDRKSRQSMRYPHGHGAKSPGPSSRNRALKKRPTFAFRKSHKGQSLESSVEQAVFAQINQPLLQYPAHETLQRRPSISSKKKKEQTNVRKHVEKNANVHQQILHMAKAHSTNPHSSNPSFPASPNRSLHEQLHSDANWVQRANTMRIKQNKMSMTPQPNNHLLGFGDHFDQNPAIQSKISRPSSPNNTMYKRKDDSMSFGAHNMRLQAQHSAKNPLYALSIQTSNLSIQPKELFTTPQTTTMSQKGSRRNSIYSRSRRNSRLPMPPAPQNSVNTNVNAMSTMMLAVFQSLPMQQKKELLRDMNMQMAQSNAAVAAAQNPANFKGLSLSLNLHRPSTFISKSKSAQDCNVSKGISDNKYRTGFRSHSERERQKNENKKPLLKDDSSIVKKLNTMTKTKQLKDRMHSQIKAVDHALFDIRESAQTSNSKSESSILPKRMSDNQNVNQSPLPSAAPIMPGTLSTLHSQQEKEFVKALKVHSNNDDDDEQSEHSVSDIDSDGVLSPFVDNSIAPQLFPKKKEAVELIGPSNILSPIQATPIDTPSSVMPIKLRIVDHESNKSNQNVDLPLPELAEQITQNTPQPNEVNTPRQSVINQIIQNKTEYINQSKNNDNDFDLYTLKPTESNFNKISSHSASSSSAGDFSTESDVDSPPPTPGKSPQIAQICTDSPRKLLLSQGLKKKKNKKQRIDSRSASLDLDEEEFKNNEDEHSEDDEESADRPMTKQRLSSADLFALDVLSHASAEDFGFDSNRHQTVRFAEDVKGQRTANATPVGGAMDSDTESSKTDQSEPNEYSIKLHQKLHPSEYQKHKNDSLTTMSVDDDGNELKLSHRIGVKLESHAIHQASMMDVGMNPYVSHSDGETEEEAVDYFGGKTPIKVREGTETIQKTLRAVWVRGHTSIGTLIHLTLILINCMAAVMFVAAIEGYKNDEMEYFFTSAFLVDFCLRLYAAKSALRYLRSAKGIGDFVSVIPGIVLAFDDFGTSIPLWTFSFVRAMRVLRIVRLLRHMVNVDDAAHKELNDPIDIEAAEFMQQIYETDPREKYCGCFSSKFWVMSKVTYIKVLLVSYLLMVVFVGAGLFACVEGPQSEHVEVENFFESFYFIVVTVTTVGYGDYSPKTELGQICIILTISVAFIVVPYRASMLSRIEYEMADQESELSVMDFNLDDLKDNDEEYDDEPRPFFGYCANCAGPRWTIGTEEMPISCMHCYHPVLTKDQVEDWFPDIADALNSFVTDQQNELLALMLDAKEGADGGRYLEVFQHFIRSGIDPEMITEYVTMSQLQQQAINEGVDRAMEEQKNAMYEQYGYTPRNNQAANMNLHLTNTFTDIANAQIQNEHENAVTPSMQRDDEMMDVQPSFGMYANSLNSVDHLEVNKHTLAPSSSEYISQIEPIEEEDSKVEMISPVHENNGLTVVKKIQIHVTPDPDPIVATNESAESANQSGWVAVNYTPGVQMSPSEDKVNMNEPQTPNHARKSTPAQLRSVFNGLNMKRLSMASDDILKESPSISAFSSNHNDIAPKMESEESMSLDGGAYSKMIQKKRKMFKTKSDGEIFKKGYTQTPNGSSSEDSLCFDRDSEDEMYENKEHQNDLTRLSIIIDDKIKSNKYYSRKRAATELGTNKKKNEKKMSSHQRRKSFHSSSPSKMISPTQKMLSPQLRSKSAVVWSDEESDGALDDEDEEQLNKFFDKLEKEKKISPTPMHQHRSSAEKIELWKQKLFSPKTNIISNSGDSKFAFHKGADAAKTVTNLMVNQSMTNSNKAKRKKRGRNGSGANPMHDYHSKKVLEDLDAQFGGSMTNEIDSSFGTPRNATNDVFGFSKKSKLKKSKKKKKSKK